MMRIRQKKDFNSTQSLFNSNENTDHPSPFTSEFSQFSPPSRQPKSSLDKKTRAQLQHLQQSSYNFGNIGISRPVTDDSDLQQKTNSSGENNKGIKQNLAPLIQRNITSRSSNHLQASPRKSLPQKINLSRHSSSRKNIIQRTLMSVSEFRSYQKSEKSGFLGWWGKEKQVSKTIDPKKAILGRERNSKFDEIADKLEEWHKEKMNEDTGYQSRNLNKY